jgi:drug/metabolite transporter (DMT)-like permease
VQVPFTLLLLLHAMKQTTKAHLALLGANLFYGAGFSVAKTIMPALIPPQAFILIRVGVTCALFWCSYLISKDFRTTIDKKDWPRLIGCAALGVATNQLFFFMGLSKTSPIHASLIMLSTPILVTIIAAYFLKEKLSLQKIVGLIIAVIGAVVLVNARSDNHLASNSVLGDFYIFINAAAYAFYLALVKPLMQKYRPIIVIRWLFLIGLFFVFPFGIQQLLNVPFATFTAQHWQAVVFIVICVTFCTYLWNIFALRVLSASIAGAYIYLQPIFAAIIAVFFMNESLTVQKIIAAVLIFTGVVLATRMVTKKVADDKN